MKEKPKVYQAPDLFDRINNLEEAKVILMLLEFLDEDNRVVIDLARATRKFEIRLDKALAAIERLVQAKYLKKEAKVGAKHSYRVSYDVACLDIPENRDLLLAWCTN